jgi:putative ABC transport system ATP-binding protein
MSVLLEAKGISHSFDYTLFENLDIALNPSESIAVLGVSGSGKSTILHILSTLLSPQDGEVFYNGKNLYTLSNQELLQIRRFDMGIIFQQHYLFKGFSAKENIDIANILSNQTIDDALMEQLGIAQILHKDIGSISGGQQQRISIARVLSKRPKIIFADEPTGNLDTQTAKDVMGVMFEYIAQNNAALFMVTHDENLASRCAKAYTLQDKKLQPWS